MAGKRKQTGASGEAAKRRKGAGTLAIDDLPWKPVDSSRLFGDAEGFLSLEEIDGCDLIQENGTIRIEMTSDKAAKKKGSSSGAIDNDEFEGFSDDPDAPAPEKAKKKAKAKKGKGENKEGAQSNGQTEINAKSTPAKSAKAKAKDQSKPEVEKSKAKAASGDSKADAELSGGGFALLADVEDDEDSGADVSAWVPLDLAPPMLSCLAQLNFSKPTAIQSASIPLIVAGHDVIGKASTGSGKTLAFGIPVVQRWLAKDADRKAAGKASIEKKRKGKKGSSGIAFSPTALILSPTRELAQQIAKHIKALCAPLPSRPYVCTVMGGMSLHKQQRELEKADIVVGTPGRLWEVMKDDPALLDGFKTVEFLVVDEADRLLADGHFKEAEEIVTAIDRVETNEEDEEEREGKPRQTLVFSATFNKGLQQKLAGKGKAGYDLMDQAESIKYLKERLNFREEDPQFIDVNPVSRMAENLREGIIVCDAMEKDLYLYAVLLTQQGKRTLVFANAIDTVRRLAPMLKLLDLPADTIHAQMAQKARLQRLERFTAAKDSRGAVLLATDVAARGLDIPGIDMVVHYHVPRVAADYVHRSGRTARATNSGASVLLCSPDELTPTQRLVAKIHETTLKKAGITKSAIGTNIDPVDVNRHLVNRLKDRLRMAKLLADAELAKGKGNKEDQWERKMAEELGIEVGSDGELDMPEVSRRDRGRGQDRRRREQEARSMSKGEAAAIRAQLKALLAKPINTGLYDRYIAGTPMSDRTFAESLGLDI